MGLELAELLHHKQLEACRSRFKLEARVLQYLHLFGYHLCFTARFGERTVDSLHAGKDCRTPRNLAQQEIALVSHKRRGDMLVSPGFLRDSVRMHAGLVGES